MADIKLKDIAKLETWNTKELRKLRMTIKNRISALENSANPKDLSSKHPLANMGIEECQGLLQKVQKAERQLLNSSEEE